MAEVLEPPAAREDGPSLEDIAGDGEALVAARQLVADLALWQHGKLVWNDLCRSLLLYGRPGPGKTWLARAMGNSAAEVDAAIRKARAAARSAGRALRLDDLRAQVGTSDLRVTDGDRRAAMHECGHAIAGTALDYGQAN